MLVLSPHCFYFLFVCLRVIIKTIRKCSVSTELKIKNYGVEFQPIGMDDGGGGDLSWKTGLPSAREANK